jgi:hypothetical protein
MASKKGFALKAFITGIVCIVMVGFGWLSDPLIANDQSGALARLLAWFSLAAAAVALALAIYFTFRALTIREPQKNLIWSLKQTTALKALNRIASQITNAVRRYGNLPRRIASL